MSRSLRFITYLAPSLPEGLFAGIAAHIAQRVGATAQLEIEGRSSGPMHGDRDPFAEGVADVGFVCSPSYLYLQTLPRPSVQLVPAGFVFQDERSGDRPVYHSDVVVRHDHPAQCFEDLADGVWGFNDECSLSGYFATLQHLQEVGCTSNFFGRRERTGSHLKSLEAILSGKIDGAAVDSTSLALQFRARPELAARVRVVESWGPFPIQPVVVRSSMEPALQAGIADALLELDSGRCRELGLDGFGLEKFVPIGASAYAEERRALQALGKL